MVRIPGIFCLNTDCKNYYEDNCMVFWEKNTLNISSHGACKDFEKGVFEGYKYADLESD